jgi:hypothetical protein
MMLYAEMIAQLNFVKDLLEAPITTKLTTSSRERDAKMEDKLAQYSEVVASLFLPDGVTEDDKAERAAEFKVYLLAMYRTLTRPPKGPSRIEKKSKEKTV